MDDAGAVRRFERIGNLNGHLQQLRHRAVARIGVGPSTAALRAAPSPGSGARASCSPMSWTVRDVRMVECRDRARLAFEPPQPVAVGREGGRQDLDRNAAPEPRIARPIDLAHPACAEQADDFIRSEMRAFPGAPWLGGYSSARCGGARCEVQCGVRGARCGVRCGVRGTGAGCSATCGLRRAECSATCEVRIRTARCDATRCDAKCRTP